MSVRENTRETFTHMVLHFGAHFEAVTTHLTEHRALGPDWLDARGGRPNIPVYSSSDSFADLPRIKLEAMRCTLVPILK
jgi:hypothetical protein